MLESERVVCLSLSCDLNNLPLIKSVEKCSLKSRWRQLAGKRLKSGPRPFNPSKTVLTGQCTIYHYILAWSLQLIVIQRPCIVRSYSENHIFMLILLLSTALFNFLTIFDHAENTRWILSGNIKCWKNFDYRLAILAVWTCQKQFQQQTRECDKIFFNSFSPLPTPLCPLLMVRIYFQFEWTRLWWLQMNLF